MATAIVITLLLSACAAPPPPRQAPAEKISASEVNQELVRKGYRVVKHDGRIGYCRSEPITGTQFKKTVCMTEEQIRDQQRKTTETQDSMDRQRSNPGCMPPACG